MIPRAPAPRVLGLALCLGLLGATCGQSTLSIMPGVVNNPGNLTLRREILGFGMRQICTELRKQSIPLRLRDEDPATGRFYPISCLTQELANGNLFIQLGGFGFVWTNLTKRMSFDASMAVEYDQDFLMDGDTMYVYFRQRATNAAAFTTKLVERPADLSAYGGSVFAGPWMSNLPLAQGSASASALGAQFMKTELTRGFTVIRGEDGAIQFGLGIVEKGQRPQAPYQQADHGKLILANERTEIHQSQRDYVGPIEVTEDDQALTLTIAIEGAPAIDVLLATRSLGEPWLQAYTTQAALTPPPSLPLLDEPVISGAVWRRTVALPKGLYYVVLDNTAAAGRTQPTTYALDDRAALVSYAVELGEAP